MKPLDRNIGALEHIVVYCQQIEYSWGTLKGTWKGINS